MLKSKVLIYCEATACSHVHLQPRNVCKWGQCTVSGLDQFDSYVSDGLCVCVCVCVRVSMLYVWNLFVKERCGISCRHAPQGLQICFPCHSSLTVTKNTFSLSECPPPTRHPTPSHSLCVRHRCGISPAGCATSSWKKQRSSKKEMEEKLQRRRRRSGRHWQRQPDRTWQMLRR